MPDSVDPRPEAPPASFAPNPGETNPAEKKSFFDKRLSERPERFEDFEPWQEARRFVNRVYEITQRPEFMESRGLCDEVRLAAVATMSHLAGAVESGHDREFTRGLNQAAGAAARVRSLMYVTIDQGQLPEAEANELVGRAASLRRMITSQILRLKRTETRDFKRKSGGMGGKKPFGKDRGGKPKFHHRRE